MIGAVGIGAFPFRQVNVEWDVPMDTSVIPALGSFTVFNDGVPFVPTVINWFSPTVLILTYGGAVGAGTGIVSLDVCDPNLRSAADLAIACAPQSVEFTYV